MLKTIHTTEFSEKLLCIVVGGLTWTQNVHGLSGLLSMPTPFYDFMDPIRSCLQVRRCMAESFGLLLRGEIEHVLRSSFGMAPHQRWQALLGRADPGLMDAGVDSSRLDSGGSGTLRTYVCLSQFREDGVRLSDDWRRRSSSYRIKRRGASAIRLTKAERAAVVDEVSSAGEAGVEVGPNLTVPIPYNSVGITGDRHMSEGTQPALPPSLPEEYHGIGKVSMRPLLPRTGYGDNTGTNIVNALGNLLEETGEVLSFFLEVAVTESLDVDYKLITAAISTTKRTRNSLRHVVAETYRIMPYQLTIPAASKRGSLEAVLLPSEPTLTMGVKRSASCIDGGDLEPLGLTMRDARAASFEHVSFHQNDNGVRSAKKVAFSSGLSERPVSSGRLGSSGTCPGPENGSPQAQAQLHKVLQVCHRIMPFARLQHAMFRVGTRLSLDFDDLTQYSGRLRQASPCVVVLAGEGGWSSREVAATSATVSFFAGHTQADRWEWEVSLGSRTLLMDYVATRVADTEDRETVAIREATKQYLPLVQHVEVVSVDTRADGAHVEMGKGVIHTEEGTTGWGKYARFCFPPRFSVHAMCRSFALAGEGLATMQTLTAQATKFQQNGWEGEGYRVVSCSPIHVVMHDSRLNHVVFLTHSAFSVKHIESAKRPGLVLISLHEVPTCPAAMQELEAAVRKHHDLAALLHGLSRTVPVLAVVADIVPGVGDGAATNGERECPRLGEFLLAAVSPACFVISSRSARSSKELPSVAPQSRSAALTLDVLGGGHVRVSGVGRKDVTVDITAFRVLLLEWITPA